VTFYYRDAFDHRVHNTSGGWTLITLIDASSQGKIYTSEHRSRAIQAISPHLTVFIRIMAIAGE